MSNTVPNAGSSAAEAARLAAVAHYEILDTPPDGAFDDIAALAAALCGTPIATVSVVDADRVWFAATHGLDGVVQAGSEPGLCVSAVLSDEVYIVTDAAIDPRTLEHPLVRGELGLRFYAAAPIITADGHRLGTVNVIDREPRQIAESQCSQLGHLARVVARHLEVRLAAIHAVRAERELRSDAQCHAALVSAGRERSVTAAFVSIANTLVADGDDIAEMLSGLTEDCARLLDIASVGLLLADAQGELQVAAASTERTHDLELFQLQCKQGPCLDAYRTQTAILVADLGGEQSRWPRFAGVAVEAGFASVHALPVRLGETGLGTLGLFGVTAGPLNREDLALAQAFAHVAAIALVAGKAAADQITLTEQLQNALTSRVVIEQAKGILAQLGGLGIDQAFGVLRGYARQHNQHLTEIARRVVSRDLPAAAVLDHARAHAARERASQR